MLKQAAKDMSDKLSSSKDDCLTLKIHKTIKKHDGMFCVYNRK